MRILIRVLEYLWSRMEKIGSGIGINIPDPQNCLLLAFLVSLLSFALASLLLLVSLLLMVSLWLLFSLLLLAHWAKVLMLQVIPVLAVNLLFLLTCSWCGFKTSVADPDPNPDPDPPDPRVFGPPGSGSGSTSQRYGSGSFYHHAKIVRKTLIPPILWLFLNFYLWKMM